MHERGPHRLFFALVPGESLSGRIAQVAARLVATAPGAGRRVDPARYHMTLRFLGGFRALEPTLLEALRGAVQGLHAASFSFELDQAGSFRNRSIPWWLGCAEPPPPLAALRAALEDVLQGSGVRMPAVPSFVPHVTVVRDAACLLPTRAIEPLEWRAASLELIHSDASAAHAHARLSSWPLVS